MAYLHGLQITGRLGELSAYKRWDSDKIIIRRKGGGSKEKLMTSKRCEPNRKNMSEFGGRQKMAAGVRKAMWPQRQLADYNFIGSINALVMPTQALDNPSIKGKRSIRLSADPRILEGFSLNEKTTFDMIVQTAVHGQLERNTRSATIALPELLPGINFTPRTHHPLFCIQAVLGLAPDIIFDEHHNRYEQPAWYNSPHLVTVTTPWYPTIKGAPATTLDLTLNFTPPEENYTLILSIGICFGHPGRKAEVEQAVRTGAAKILLTA
jgi:hypothetical protein